MESRYTDQPTRPDAPIIEKSNRLVPMPATLGISVPRDVVTGKWHLKRLAHVLIFMSFVFGAACYYMPLWRYVTHIVQVPFELGISRNTLEEWRSLSNWLGRYFYGPPTDEEMIQFFERNKKDFERLTELWAQSSEVYLTGDRLSKSPELREIQRRLQIAPGIPFRDVPGSALRFLPHATYHAREMLTISSLMIENAGQSWIKSNYKQAAVWSKDWVFVPPVQMKRSDTIPASAQFEVAKKIMGHTCRLRESLNTVPASLDKLKPELLGLEIGCVSRSIGGQWFLTLSVWPS